MPAKPGWKFQPWWEAAALLADNNKLTVGLFLLWKLRCSGVYSVTSWPGEAGVLHASLQEQPGQRFAV